MTEFVDKTSGQSGTPLDRKRMMSIQGFDSKTVRFDYENKTVFETNIDGHTLTTKVNEDGSITETFVGEKTIVKTTRLNADGSISEVVS